MKRREFLSGLAAGAALAGPALAQDFVGSVIAQLAEMGFRSIEQERTLLGRVRIIATRADGRREIIINPNNGEILRDLWNPVRGEKVTSDIIKDKSGQGGNGGRGNDGDDGDDEGDDDEGGGNSGSGSGNSGSGGGDDDEGGDDDDDDDDGDEEGSG